MLPALLGAIGLGLLLATRRAVAGTTLVAAWGWALLAVASVAAVESWVALGGANRSAALVSHARYWAGALAACPAIAVLGSKRPQHGAWQFIVASLWVVLVLPSGEILLDRPGDPLELHAARRVFLAGLLLVGWANYLGTRYFLSATLLLAAQAGLLCDVLLGRSGVGALGSGFAAVRGWLPLVLGVLAIGWGLRQSAPSRGPAGAAAPDGWADFRDLYGCLWALRVAARLNAVAVQQGWQIRLGWDGWHTTDGGALCPAPAELESARTQLQALLKRFVSPFWLSLRHPSA